MKISFRKQIAKVLYNFFSNIFKTLGMSDYMHSHLLPKEVNDPTLRAKMNYRNHPSVLTILDKKTILYLHFLMLLRKRF